MLSEGLGKATHKDYFHNLLYFETVQEEDDIRRFDIDNVTLRNSGYLHYLKVPGLAEKRPTVLRDDAESKSVRQLVQKNGTKEEPTTSVLMKLVFDSIPVLDLLQALGTMSNSQSPTSVHVACTPPSTQAYLLTLPSLPQQQPTPFLTTCSLQFSTQW